MAQGPAGAWLIPPGAAPLPQHTGGATGDQGLLPPNPLPGQGYSISQAASGKPDSPPAAVTAMVSNRASWPTLQHLASFNDGRLLEQLKSVIIPGRGPTHLPPVMQYLLSRGGAQAGTFTPQDPVHFIDEAHRVFKRLVGQEFRSTFPSGEIPVTVDAMSEKIAAVKWESFGEQTCKPSVRTLADLLKVWKP